MEISAFGPLGQRSSGDAATMAMVAAMMVQVRRMVIVFGHDGYGDDDCDDDGDNDADDDVDVSGRKLSRMREGGKDGTPTGGTREACTS
eukprot:7019284-Pyramimonas_sp.AAC.1